MGIVMTQSVPNEAGAKYYGNHQRQHKKYLTKQLTEYYGNHQWQHKRGHK